MRKILKNFNLAEIARGSGISYNTLKNYCSGRKAHLTEEEEKTVRDFIKKIVGGM